MPLLPMSKTALGPTLCVMLLGPSHTHPCPHIFPVRILRGNTSNQKENLATSVTSGNRQAKPDKAAELAAVHAHTCCAFTHIIHTLTHARTSRSKRTAWSNKVLSKTSCRIFREGELVRSSCGCVYLHMCGLNTTCGQVQKPPAFAPHACRRRACSVVHVHIISNPDSFRTN